MTPHQTLSIRVHLENACSHHPSDRVRQLAFALELLAEAREPDLTRELRAELREALVDYSLARSVRMFALLRALEGSPENGRPQS